MKCFNVLKMEIVNYWFCIFLSGYYGLYDCFNFDYLIFIYEKYNLGKIDVGEYMW